MPQSPYFLTINFLDSRLEYNALEIIIFLPFKIFYNNIYTLKNKTTLTRHIQILGIPEESHKKIVTNKK